MRLIDADAMLERIKPSIFDTCDLKAMLDKQPTAYDIEKVIEQLEKRADKAKNNADVYYDKRNRELYLVCEGRAEGLKEALEVVRGEKK